MTNTSVFRHANFIDISGQKYNHLTAIKYVGNIMWLCKCDCGNEKAIRTNNLKLGYIKSCGCKLSITISGTKDKYSKKHPLYRTWIGMKQRCYNSNTDDYKNYGGRGITVCERWENSFVNFLSDMGIKPSPKHSLDRIDNDKGYSPENCRWATKSEQRRNSRQPLDCSYSFRKKVIERV